MRTIILYSCRKRRLQSSHILGFLVSNFRSDCSTGHAIHIRVLYTLVKLLLKASLLTCIHVRLHLGFASVSRVPPPALLVQLVELLVGNLLSGEVSSFGFNQPRSLGCATCFIDMPLEVVRHFAWKRGWRCGESWRGFLHIDEGLDGLRDIRDLFPVPQHREDCKHDDDGSCGHESWRVWQEALSAGFFLIGSKRNFRDLASFSEVSVQV